MRFEETRPGHDICLQHYNLEQIKMGLCLHAHAGYVFSQILDWPNLGPPQSGITTVVLLTKWHLKKKREALLVN